MHLNKLSQLERSDPSGETVARNLNLVNGGRHLTDIRKNCFAFVLIPCIVAYRRQNSCYYNQVAPRYKLFMQGKDPTFPGSLAQPLAFPGRAFKSQ